jgi:hypothetical protein
MAREPVLIKTITVYIYLSLPLSLAPFTSLLGARTATFIYFFLPCRMNGVAFTLGEMLPELILSEVLPYLSGGDQLALRAVCRRLAAIVARPAPQTLVGACDAASEAGSLPRLQWLRALRYPWSHYTCDRAAAGGHLAVLQWLRASECPWSEETGRSAARNGHLDARQWARSKDCPWCESICAARRATVVAH